MAKNSKTVEKLLKQLSEENIKYKIDEKEKLLIVGNYVLSQTGQSYFTLYKKVDESFKVVISTFSEYSVCGVLYNLIKKEQGHEHKI